MNGYIILLFFIKCSKNFFKKHNLFKLNKLVTKNVLHTLFINHIYVWICLCSIGVSNVFINQLIFEILLKFSNTSSKFLKNNGFLRSFLNRISYAFSIMTFISR